MPRTKRYIPKILSTEIYTYIANNTSLERKQVKECFEAYGDMIVGFIESNYTPEDLTVLLPKIGTFYFHKHKGRKNGSTYKFFKEIYDKYNCVCLFVGHQKEDVIETYYMQEKRNAIVEYYGMAKETFIQGMKVVRPLLAYTKKELEEYCLTHNIVYGVDETNFDLSYSRNRIRHEVISKMSEEEKNNIIEKLEILNTKKQGKISEIFPFLSLLFLLIHILDFFI